MRKKIRLAFGVDPQCSAEDREKAKAFILAEKKRIEQSQCVMIEIVSLNDDPDVVYDPLTKESWYVS